MTQRQRAILVAGIIERKDGCVLICRPDEGDGPRLWEFPGGPARDRESPEAAMRRTAAERVGLGVEIIVGQPPLLQKGGGRETEFRCFLCGLGRDSGEPGDYAEVRWVHKNQLCEYDFDQPTRDVVTWYVEQV
ncbi:MAG: NUDIX domain-containing protein [Planctomycetota bacterium]|jgi:8-oxo-dGTP pyrophosphatase MutT (NUDIX family)